MNGKKVAQDTATRCWTTKLTEPWFGEKPKDRHRPAGSRMPPPPHRKGEYKRVKKLLAPAPRASEPPGGRQPLPAQRHPQVRDLRQGHVRLRGQEGK